MNQILEQISQSSKEGKRTLAILLDPDKLVLKNIEVIVDKINESPATHIFVGGSTVASFITDKVVKEIKRYSDLPILIFPGDTNQISPNADALLFLSLTSGRNPDYLIGKHVHVARRLKNMPLEIIPTSYILIGEHNSSAVEQVTQTKPLSVADIDFIVDTAIAGEMLGHKLTYLEAGSGALNSVPYTVIKEVKNNIKIPLIVGGGMINERDIERAYTSGADMVVIGTAFEQDLNFFKRATVSMKQINLFNI